IRAGRGEICARNAVGFTPRLRTYPGIFRTRRKVPGHQVARGRARLAACRTPPFVRDVQGLRGAPKRAIEACQSCRAATYLQARSTRPVRAACTRWPCFPSTDGDAWTREDSALSVRTSHVRRFALQVAVSKALAAS